MWSAILSKIVTCRAPISPTGWKVSFDPFSTTSKHRTISSNASASDPPRGATPVDLVRIFHHRGKDLAPENRCRGRFFA